MRIELIEIFHVAMPMKNVWRTAFSEETAIDSLLVRIVADGREGWGESAPYRSPRFSPEWAASAFGLLRDWFAPELLGQDVTSGADLQARLDGFKGNHFAKAALDVAWWDAHARSRDEPLWRTLGGASPEVVVGADISVLDDIDELLAEVESARAQGFRRIKLKFRRGWGVDMVRAVREAFPDTIVHVDCNSAFALSDAAVFRELDDLGLAMIEQPLGYDDLIDHATLQSQLRTPICLDESIVSVDRARKAIEIAAGRWINIKVGRVGGLTNAIAIHDLCMERGIPCWVGGMLESAVGQAPSLALATLPNIRYPSDIFPTGRLYEADLAEPRIELSGPSTITAPDRPGGGFAPNPERLRELTVQHVVLDGACVVRSSCGPSVPRR